jgi:hypothetical protein
LLLRKFKKDEKEAFTHYLLAPKSNVKKIKQRLEDAEKVLLNYIYLFVYIFIINYF